MKKSTILFLCFILSFLLSKSQQDLPRFSVVDNTTIRQLLISNILLTRSGNLILSSADGLLLYDGSECSMITVENIENRRLSSNNVWRMVEDNKENIWIATKDGILNHYNTKTGIIKKIRIALPDQNNSAGRLEAAAIFVDSNDNLWIAADRHGLILYNPKTNSFQQYNLKPNRPPYWTSGLENNGNTFTKQEGDPNTIWLGAIDGLYKITINPVKIEHFIPSFDNSMEKLSGGFLGIRCLRSIDDSILLFGIAGTGIVRYNIQNRSYRMYPYNIDHFRRKMKFKNSPLSISNYTSGKCIVTFMDTIPASLNLNTGVYTFLDDPNLKFDFAQGSKVVTDNLNNIWIIKGGKVYYSSQDRQIFNTVSIKNIATKENGPNYLRDIKWKKDEGKYYASADFSDGIYVYDSNFSLIKTILPSGNKNDGNEEMASAVYWDSHQRIWVVSLDTLRVLKNWEVPETKIKVYDSISRYMAHEPISYLFDDVDGWFIGSQSGTLIRVFPDDSIRTYRLKNPEVKQSKKWRVSNHNSVYDTKRKYYYQSDASFIHQLNLRTNNDRLIGYKGDSSTIADNIVCFNIDNMGNIWVVTSSSVIKIFDPDNLSLAKTIPFKEFFAGGSIQKLVKGPGEKMFLETFRGIVVFDGEDSSTFVINSTYGLLNNSTRDLLVENNNIFTVYEDYFQYTSIDKVAKLKKQINPYIFDLVVNDKIFYSDSLIRYKQCIDLHHDQNSLIFKLSSYEYDFPENIQYAYRLNGVDRDWVYASYTDRTIRYPKLHPRDYLLEFKARNLNGAWSDVKTLLIQIHPAWYQTKWFKLVVGLSVFALLIFIGLGISSYVRNKEKAKLNTQKEMLELEAKALRAQMNPHFIFNCMNSIKSLMQEREVDKGVTYLTTFSKLIRTLFNNADKKEISLYDEIETCKLYLQLEAMRFDAKFSYAVNIDDEIDLKSIHVPALIIQPFIENAIWHGIVPKGGGGTVSLNIVKNNKSVEIIIDDDGIGREASKLNKAASNIGHQSKGVNLTQSRLELDNLLQQRRAVLETTDKKDADGKSMGTKVTIKIFQEE